MNGAVKLNTRVLKATGGQINRHPIIALHGFLGSISNLQGVFARSRVREEGRDVILADLRNHGDSPHSEYMAYDVHVEDISRLLDHHGIEKASIVGHSYGGRIGMAYALTYPDRVSSLLVGDIAPLDYRAIHERIDSSDIANKNDQAKNLVCALSSMVLTDSMTRENLVTQLQGLLPDTSKSVINYALSNIVHDHNGSWKWRCNLEYMERGISKMLEWPYRGQSAQTTSAFIFGERSAFNTPLAVSEAKRVFPNARVHVMTGLSHWLHTQDPERFRAVVDGFLDTCE